MLGSCVGVSPASEVSKRLPTNGWRKFRWQIIEPFHVGWLFNINIGNIAISVQLELGFSSSILLSINEIVNYIGRLCLSNKIKSIL